MKALLQRLGDLRLEIRTVVGLESDVVTRVVPKQGILLGADREIEIQPIGLVRRIVEHVDIDLCHRIAGTHPPIPFIAKFVGVIFVVVSRRELRRTGFVTLLRVEPLLAVCRAERIHLGAFALQRILDDAFDLHLDDERPLRAERILAFVTAIPLDAARADDARRHVEADFRSLAQGELLVQTMLAGILRVQMQHIAHGQVGALHEARIDIAAITVIGDVVCIFGEGIDQFGFDGPARQHDIAVQVAPRKVEPHPAGRIADRFDRGKILSGLEDFDVIVAFGLKVAQQVLAVLGHPCFQGLVLELVVGFGLLLGTRCQQQHSDYGEIEQTGDQLHILFCDSKSTFSYHSTASTVKNHATGLWRGMVLK